MAAAPFIVPGSATDLRPAVGRASAGVAPLSLDLELARKYCVPGPRYTSYPPATHFTDQVSLEQVETRIRENNERAGDLSLYFHLPFCYSLCWYCGCTSLITTQQSQSATYVNYLERELALLQSRLNPRRRVVQLHFGGGTPTFLRPDEIRRLGDAIHQRFPFADDVEAGVEIDPRRLTRDHLVALREVGFQRASIGVQDHNPVVQRAVHRVQPYAQTRQAVDGAREVGFRSINIDLIYGLPHQTPESFAATLDEVLTLAPDRLAVFNYAHVPWIKPAQKIIPEATLPSPETKLQILKLTIERLTAAGFVYIGMDHFARADDELAVAQRQKTLQRNFQGYSTRGGADIYAFGMSSISQTEDAYWQNRKELPAYYAALDAGRLPIARGYLLDPDDRIRRATILRLMCDLSLDYARMTQVLGVAFADYFDAELGSLGDLEEDGLIVRSADGLQVTDRGRLFIRNIAMRFDAHLAKERERRYSRTV